MRGHLDYLTVMPDVMDRSEAESRTAQTLTARDTTMSRAEYEAAPITIITAPELDGAPLGELLRDPEDTDAEHEAKRDLFSALLAR